MGTKFLTAVAERTLDSECNLNTVWPSNKYF